MFNKLSRRNALQFAGVGAVSLAQAKILGGCENDPHAQSAVGSSMRFELDPDTPWYMQPPFGPVARESEAFDLEVLGEIPRALDGVYLRNGPNPQSGDPGHWFLGNGMLHGVRLQKGAARWYRNRYIQTPILGRDPGTRLDPLSLTDHTSNTNVVQHAGRVLALVETGLPREVTVDDLSTVGPYDFAGKLKMSMTAHPKLDPRTGEMHTFSYGAAKPYLTYHLVDAMGELVRSEPIDLPKAVIAHDFQITETKIVFMDLPVAFDVALAVAGERVPYRWKPELGARFGIMTRDGGNADIVWIEIDPCFAFHTFNAHDDADGNVVVDLCEFPEFWVESSSRFDRDPMPCRYTIDVKSKTAKREQWDDRPVDFPVIDPRRVGAPYRYGYGLWFDTTDLSAPPSRWGLVKYDRKRDSATVREYEPYRMPGEPTFVAASPDAAEDEGFILTFVYDHAEKHGALEIFDARALRDPPLASVQIPFQVPFGFHGTWVPAG